MDAAVLLPITGRQWGSVRPFRSLCVGQVYCFEMYSTFSKLKSLFGVFGVHDSGCVILAFLGKNTGGASVVGDDLIDLKLSRLIKLSWRSC